MGLGSEIQDPEKNLFRILDPGVKKAPDPGSRGQKGTGKMSQKDECWNKILLWVIYHKKYSYVGTKAFSKGWNQVHCVILTIFRLLLNLDPHSQYGSGSRRAISLRIRIYNTAGYHTVLRNRRLHRYFFYNLMLNLVP
jgi:hypothetical protein